MDLTTEAIKEFQEIYQRKFSVVLTEAEAKLKAEGFLNLMLLITRTSKNDQT